MPKTAPELTLVEKRRILAGSTLFASLRDDDLSTLAKLAVTSALRRGDDLFHKGDAGTQIFIVVSGLLKAHSGSGGEAVLFDLIGASEVFGEIAALGDSARTATVTAVDPSLLLALDGKALLDLVRRRPEAAIQLIRTQIARVKHLSDRIEDSRFLKLPFRLAKQLLLLAKEHGHDDAGAVRIDLRLSQTDLGSIVGVSRESVNHQLGIWREEGLIELDRGQISILQPSDLEQLARGMLV